MSESQVWGLPSWFTKAFGYLVVTVFGLIALGGSVRIMDAGLACPDWPLCFGELVPEFHPQVYFEFIHRVVAGLVSVALILLQSIIMFRSKAPKWFKGLALFTLFLVASQVVLGGLTVLWQLHSKIVAAHLGLGTAFFSTLLWMWLCLKSKQGEGQKVEKSIKPWTVVFTTAIYGQIILGGLVASHFASLVCTDFPTCQGQWFPTFSGIVGLHVIHRLGAYTIVLLAIVNLAIMFNFSENAQLKKLGKGIFAMIIAQVGLGIANVLFLMPPVIAVAHLAVATAILSLAIRQLHIVYFARAVYFDPASIK